MAKQSLDFGQQTDDEILYELDQEMQKLKSDKEKIIKQAATLLEESGKYKDDLTVIASKIHHKWDWISKSYIYDILPDKFKRPYTKKEDAIAEDIVDEILLLMADQLEELSQICNDIFKKCKEDQNVKNDVSEALKQAIHQTHTNLDKFVEKLRKELSTIGQLQNLLEFVKNQQTDIDYIKTLTDYRENLDVFFKIRLKLTFVQEHLADVGKKIHYSSKWMSATKRDPLLDNLIQKFRFCPCCGWDMAEWFIKSSIAESKGRKIPEPQVPKQILCATCKGPLYQ